MTGKSVSVVVSVYGPGWGTRLSHCLRALMQSSGTIEVILSEQYTSRLDYRDTAEAAGTNYVADLRKGPFWNPGRCRNRGASMANGSILFFLDADLLLLKREVFAATAELLRGQPRFIAAPKVFRILENAHGFLSSIDGKKSARAMMWAKLSYLGNTFWGLPGVDHPVVRTVHHGKVYYAATRDAALYARRKHEYRGREVEIWKPQRHYGTMAMPTGLFRAVGGYCEAFRQWGCEDTDLAQKAAAIAVAVDTARLDWSFAHLEHAHAHIDVRQALRNQRLLAARSRKGLRTIIQEDRKRYQQNYTMAR